MSGRGVSPLIGSEAHAIRVVRVVVVVRVATGIDVVEVVRIVAIRTALPPVADGTCACRDKPLLCFAGVLLRLFLVVTWAVQFHVSGVVQVALEGVLFFEA